MRLRALDGIRGIAILLVIFHHHHILERIGWVGVDLFFVLSGYLITTILLREQREPLFWQRFYLKRAFRLAPALVLTLIAVVALQRNVPWLGLAGYVFFVGNWMNITPFHISLLGGLWSLAVEEHFYMAWPGLVRNLSRRAMMSTLIALLVAGPLLRALVTPHLEPLTIYFMTPFRLDPIAWGSLLALLAYEVKSMAFLKRYSGLLAVACWTLVTVLTLTIPSFDRGARSVPFNSFGYALIALAGFFTVAFGVTSESTNPIHRLLSLRWLTFVGQISYGMYLFEPFVSSITHHIFHVPFEGPGTLAMRRYLPLDLILLLAVASASFYLWETPIRTWGMKRFLRETRIHTDESLITSAAKN